MKIKKKRLDFSIFVSSIIFSVNFFYDNVIINSFS